MSIKVSPVDFENAIQLYVSGESAENAGKRFHVSPSRLVAVLKERGLFRSVEERRAIGAPKWGMAQQIKLPIEEIIERYVSGETEQSLARAYGVDRGTISKRLKDAGIQRRTMSQAGTIKNANLTPEQRSQYANAAHEAVRGRKHSLDEKIQRAQTRQSKQLGVSDTEKLLREWIKQRGIDIIPQMAVGPYNVDIGTDTVAVEIFGGSWHGTGIHRERAPERCRYLLDRGFNLIIIWTDARKWPLSEASADYVASFIQLTCSDPSIRGQYRVIWGDGKEVPLSRLNIDNLSVIPSRRTS